MLGPDKFIAITDSLPGAGFTPGEYKMVDGREFTNRDGIARLTSEDATVVGSILTMNKAFANLVKHCDIPLTIAARYTSTNPAKALGLDNELGSIQPGKTADLTVLDENYKCIATFINGECIYAD